MAEGDGQRELKKSYLLIKDVGKEVDAFRESIRAHNAATAEVPSDLGSFVKGIRSKLSLGRNRQELLRNLDLASTAIDTAEKQDPKTKIDVEEGELSLAAARAMVCRLRGSVEFVAGRLRQAVEHYKRSIDLVEFPDTDLLLAWAYEVARQPDLALTAYERCIEVASDEETEVEAQKAAARLRAGMLLGGWFVGSWKIFGVLAFFAVAGLIAVISGGGVQLIPGTLIFCGLAALYGWRKFRRPSNGAIATEPHPSA